MGHGGLALGDCQCVADGFAPRPNYTTYRDNSLTSLASLDVKVDAETDAFAWTTTLQLADQFRLTLYDASYLELAQRRELPLATLDADLRKAAETVGMPLLGL
jgi:predicted nucleic acid-binding protein